MSLRIVFAGTPDFAAGNLQALIDAELDVVATYSQPDRPKGRGKKLIPTPVKQVALAHDIPVYQPLNFKDSADVEALTALNADIMVVVAYGLLLPKAVLETPRLGCINVHASLLPRWRGAAPIERALETGDGETGITIMQMDEGLDTGDMLVTRSLAINPSITGDELRAQLLALGTPALIESLEQLAAGNAAPEAQDNRQANYAYKLSKSEAELDWSQNADALMRKIHAFNSANICYSLYGGERIKISQVKLMPLGSAAKPGEIIELGKKSLVVATGNGALALTEVQLPNAKRMPIAAVLNGKADFFSLGSLFSSAEINTPHG